MTENRVVSDQTSEKRDALTGSGGTVEIIQAVGTAIGTAGGVGGAAAVAKAMVNQHGETKRERLRQDGETERTRINRGDS